MPRKNPHVCIKCKQSHCCVMVSEHYVTGVARHHTLTTHAINLGWSCHNCGYVDVDYVPGTIDKDDD